MPEDNAQAKMSRLPSIDQVVNSVTPGVVRWCGRPLAVDAAREVLDEYRAAWRTSGSLPPMQELTASVECRIKELMTPSLRHAINATGVVLHTGLGRAALSGNAFATAVGTIIGHSTLELDVLSGERGNRQAHVAPLLCELTGAESAHVVNNDAGAVLLALAAIARGREVIVSRGELVEIGGGFRIPDVMLESGAILREVGTTNKTRLRDYQTAITPNTACLLKVHPSNYRIEGFTESVGTAELAELAHEHSLPLIDDLGSGALVDIGLGEPTVQERLNVGADMVLFSGDKLLGGPQAGIAVGRRCLIDKMAVHPLARALRCDKVSLALLESTLRQYRRGVAADTVPTLRAISRSPDSLQERAERLAASLRNVSHVNVHVVESVCRVGAGALPQHELPSFAMSVQVDGWTADGLSAALRTGKPAIFARIEHDRLQIEVRTLLSPAEADSIVSALRKIAEGKAGYGSESIR